MKFDEARATILSLLQTRGKATNSEMLRVLGGDAELFAAVREALILDDAAKDKDGVGLIATPSLETSAVPSAWPAAGDAAAQAPARLESPTVAAHARLFLSYGRRDARELATRLTADLRRHGYEVWQDTQEIRAGTSWEQAIGDGLRSAQLVIALLSPHATRGATNPSSPDNLDSVCLDEISFARFTRPPKPIVPIMAITCEPPFCIFRLDYVDLCCWRESESQYQAGLKRVLEAIEAALRGEVRYRSFDNQLKPWDFAAFLNEKRRHFCGRQWLFTEIEAWRATSRERALLITGDPGTGKSALVAQLIHLNPGGQVLAYHCCQADTPATLRPGLFVRSLAAMIASKLEVYETKLVDRAVQEALSEENCARDPASAFEAGILTPLESLPAPPEGVRYILVDALDEALALGDGPGRSTIVELLAARLDRLPAWIRLVATTRKERAVLDRLRGLQARELDAHDPRNLDDIEQYISLRLSSPELSARLAASGRPAPFVRQVLREKCAGNFLYLQQVFQGIERGLHDFASLDALPPGLTGLYLSFFTRHFPDEASYAPARRMLDVVVAAQEPLDEQQLACATSLDAEEELPRVLRRLSAYLPARDARYSLYHKSLADWLTDPDLRGALHAVSRKRGHERLAEMCWTEYRGGPAQMSLFALRHLPTHLAACDRWQDLAEAFCDLRFIEAKCAAGMTFDLVADYAAALNAWPGRQSVEVFGQGAEALPPWFRPCTTAALAGEPDPHPEKGAGRTLAALRALPADKRDLEPQQPRFAPADAIPESHFGPDRNAAAVMEEMKRAEAASTPGRTHSPPDTPEPPAVKD